MYFPYSLARKKELYTLYDADIETREWMEITVALQS
jgi:hypothetical protein